MVRTIPAVLGGALIGGTVVAALDQRWGGDIGAFLQAIPDSVATLAAAGIGLGVVIWQARKGFEAIIEGQNHRAEIEAKARLDQDRLDRERVAADRKYEQIVLAAALHGELSSLLKSVHRNGQLARAQATVMKAAAEDRTMADMQAFEVAIPIYRVPLYEANVARLGILGASIAGDVATVFSKATIARQDTQQGKLTPALAKMVYDALAEGGIEWGWEIVQVSGRLIHLQTGAADPGPLSDAAATKAYRQKAEKMLKPTE